MKAYDIGLREERVLIHERYIDACSVKLFLADIGIKSDDTLHPDTQTFLGHELTDVA